MSREILQSGARERIAGGTARDERPRTAGACCIFYILLTFAPDTVRSRALGVSAKSMAVPRRTAGPVERKGESKRERKRERQGERRASSRVTGFVLFTNGGGYDRDRGVARVRPVCEPAQRGAARNGERLLTREYPRVLPFLPSP